MNINHNTFQNNLFFGAPQPFAQSSGIAFGAGQPSAQLNSLLPTLQGMASSTMGLGFLAPMASFGAMAAPAGGFSQTISPNFGAPNTTNSNRQQALNRRTTRGLSRSVRGLSRSIRNLTKLLGKSASLPGRK